jgi:HlyD family secretion protein
MNEENIENPDEPTVEEIDETSEVSTAETVEKPPSKLRQAVVLTAVIAAMLLAGLVYWRYTKKAETPETSVAAEADKKVEIVVSVKVAKAEKDSLSQEFSAVGTVFPKEQASVSSSISAQIKQMRLFKNSFVRKGEVIAVLASQDLQSSRKEALAALEEAKLNLQTLQNVTIPQNKYQIEKDLADAKANLDNAEATYVRRKDLYEKGGLSLKELEATQLAMSNAENSLRLIQQNSKLNTSAVNPNSKAIAESKIKQAQERIKSIDTQATLTEVRSPMSGIVTEQTQFEGEFATQGGKLLTIANIAEVIVKAAFADSVAANLKDGDSVMITSTAYPDDKIGGKVTLISRSADSQNRTVEIWANFGNPRGLLRIGDSVQFVISANPTENAVIIPLTAVTLDATNGEEGTVMTVDKQSVTHETKVTIGIKQGDKVEIKSGLKGGETVVIDGNYALPDGTKVEIAEDKKEEN